MFTGPISGGCQAGHRGAQNRLGKTESFTDYQKTIEPHGMFTQSHQATSPLWWTLFFALSQLITSSFLATPGCNIPSYGTPGRFRRCGNTDLPWEHVLFIPLTCYFWLRTPRRPKTQVKNCNKKHEANLNYPFWTAGDHLASHPISPHHLESFERGAC